MKIRSALILLLILINHLIGFAQNDLLALADADSAYVRKHVLPNDLRLFYGGQGNNVSLGTKRGGDTPFNGYVYTNTNDYVGMERTVFLSRCDVSI